jgi:chemotaxis protein MotB
MMAFFMVMWLTSQKDEIKQAVAGYFRDPFATVKGHEKGAAAEAKPIDDPKEGQPDRQKRRAAKSGDNTNYQFTVLFGDAAAELDPAGKEAIRTFAPTLVGKLNRIEVRGHCLGKPLPDGSPFSDLWDFCYARSRAVKEELEQRGVEADRIRISVAADNEPIAANLRNEELKLNSRVDVILLPDLVENPWRVGVESTANTEPQH